MEIIMTIAICLVLAVFITIVSLLTFHLLKLEIRNAFNWVISITFALSIVFCAIYLTGGTSLLTYLLGWIGK